MILTPEQIMTIETIKVHMKREIKDKNIQSSEQITDDMAIEYALGVTDLVLKNSRIKPAMTKKQKLRQFIEVKKSK